MTTLKIIARTDKLIYVNHLNIDCYLKIYLIRHLYTFLKDFNCYAKSARHKLFIFYLRHLSFTFSFHLIPNCTRPMFLSNIISYSSCKFVQLECNALQYNEY